MPRPGLSPSQSRGQRGGGGEGQFIKLSIGVLSQVTVIAAVLYYFGWARTQGALAFFGLDPEVVDLSVADYVLRSVRPLLVPTLVILLGTFVAASMHTSIVAPYLGSTRCRKDRVRRVLVCVEVLCGLVLVATLTITSSWGGLAPRANLVAPTVFAVAPMLFAYSRLCRTRFHLQSVSARRRRGPLVVDPLVQRLLYVLSACGLFWAIGVYANDSGQTAAEALSRHLDRQSDVVVYCSERLAISGTGVDVREIGQADSKFKFEYTGLRLLIKDASHYVLLPAGWRAGHDSAIDVPEDDSTRFDIRSSAQ